MLFSDFVGMPTCVRNMEIKKVLKVAVVMMINDLMSVYQVSCQTPKFQRIHSQGSETFRSLALGRFGLLGPTSLPMLYKFKLGHNICAKDEGPVDRSTVNR